MADLVAAVAEIKADGARISPANVLAQLQKRSEFSNTTLSQVRRAITRAPKAHDDVRAERRAGKKRAYDTQRDRVGRARPVEVEEAKRQKIELKEQQALIPVREREREPPMPSQHQRGRPRKDAPGWHALPVPPSLPDYGLFAGDLPMLHPMPLTPRALPHVHNTCAAKPAHLPAPLASQLAAAMTDVAPQPPPVLARRHRAPPPEVPQWRPHTDFPSHTAYEAYRHSRRKAQKRVNESQRAVRDRSGRARPARERQAEAARAIAQGEEQALLVYFTDAHSRRLAAAPARIAGDSSALAVSVFTPTARANAIPRNVSTDTVRAFAARTVAVVQAARDHSEFRDRCTTNINFHDGSVYCGELKVGKAHGFGVCAWPSGECYEGQWSNAQRQGHGTCTTANGDIFTGAWEMDLKEGLIHYLYVSHNTMAGCVEISYYEANEPVGENVVWGPDRATAYRWTPDDRLETISLELAKDIETRLLKGRRPIVFAEVL